MALNIPLVAWTTAQQVECLTNLHYAIVKFVVGCCTETLETRLISAGPHGNDPEKIPAPRFAHTTINIGSQDDGGEVNLVYQAYDKSHQHCKK